MVAVRVVRPKFIARAAASALARGHPQARGAPTDPTTVVAPNGFTKSAYPVAEELGVRLRRS